MMMKGRIASLLSQNYKLMEAFGLLLALGAWAADQVTRRQQDRIDASYRSVMAISEIAQHQLTRDYLTVRTSLLSLEKLNDLNERKLAERLWKSSPHFRRDSYSMIKNGAIIRNQQLSALIDASNESNTYPSSSLWAGKTIKDNIDALIDLEDSNVPDGSLSNLADLNNINSMFAEYDNDLHVAANELWNNIQVRKDRYQGRLVWATVIGSILLFIAKLIDWLNRDAETSFTCSRQAIRGRRFKPRKWAHRGAI